MDLASTLAKRITRRHALQLSDYVLDKQKEFKKLIEIYLSGSYVVTHYSAHVIEAVIRQRPSLITPYINRLLKSAQRIDVHNAEKRNTVRLLQFIKIPQTHRGKVVDMCFRFLQDHESPIAVKVFSMTVLDNNTKNMPDLQRELKLILEEKLPFESAAFRSRARKILNRKS